MHQLTIASLGLLAIGCSPKYYIPNTQNVPVIRAKGQSSITVAGNGNQAELQGAYGISDHLAIQANGGYVFPKNESSETGGYGKMIEGGIGYFTNVNPNMHFDVYALIGGGNMENHFPGSLAQNPNTTGIIEANFMRFGVQPSFSYYNKFFTVTGSTRLASLNYSNVRGSLIFDGVNQVNYLNDNASTFLLEPALTVRGGFEKIKLQVQLMKSFNLFNKDFRQDDTLLSFGLNFNL